MPDTAEQRVAQDRERGSMHVMTIPIAVGLVSVAVLVIAMLGSATNDRREAGTAADAAALAATQEWDDRLGLLHSLHLGVLEPAGFWEIAEEALLGPELEKDMFDTAKAYAEANGAELVDLDIDTAQLRVTAEVRHREPVPGTGTRSTASAKAGITLRGGLCVALDGLGWMIDGECVTEPEPDEDEAPGGDSGAGDADGETGDEDSGPGDDDPDKGDDEDDWTPPDVDDYSSTVVLVD